MAKAKSRPVAKWTVAEAKKLAGDMTGRHGGHLADVPLPLIRLFDDKRRRRAVGVSVGVFDIGLHYHVGIKEEDNPVLNRIEHRPYYERPCWQISWNDEDSRGLLFADKFDTETSAAKYVVKVWRKEFSPKTHRLEISNLRMAKLVRELLKCKKSKGR